MAVPYVRQNRIASSSPKDFSFASFMYANEIEHPMWHSPGRMLDFVKSRPDSVSWNVLVAALALISFIIVSFDYESKENMFGIPLTLLIDIAYNIIYCLHVAGNLFRYYNNNSRWYLVDLVSYSHYLTSYSPEYIENRVPDLAYIVKITCYHLRLHRPFRFLWGLSDYYLKGSISGTMFKYWYINTVLHIMCANLYVWIQTIEPPMYTYLPEWISNNRTLYIYRSIYVVYKRFLPIGMDKAPRLGSEAERLLELFALITSSLMVTGITIASLSLAIGLHLRPEEMFRARVRLIMNDMKATHVPTVISGKVDTFYRMYWHKQKAVSVTQLLPTYPPTLANTIHTDIYFEAQQKSIILRDLSYQFLSEIAQQMKTINYIPGDIIIRRNSRKFAMIYISYGDVEMLTAEDDETPILRFTRGSVMNPCAGAAGVASSQAHVCIRAATFCTAHVLNAVDIWRVTAKFGRFNGQSFILKSSFQEHFEKVMRHYAGRPHPPVKYKSTILVLKRNLIELKEARDETGELILGRQDMFLELAGCYIMRNQADAALTEESDTICLRPTFPCILQPASSLLISWKIFVAIMTIIVIFVHPYNLVFIKTPHVDFRFFDFMTTIVYIVDIIVHLSTGDKIEEGVPVTFLQTSSKQVSSFWFVLDVISVMPVFTFLGDGSFAGMNKVCKLPMVFRVLKEMEDISLYQSNVLRFFAYCLLIIITKWLVATLQQAYMCLGHGYCNLKSITTQPYWEKGELQDTENAVIARVWYSVYWALSFTTFTAHKTAELTMYYWDMQLFIMILLEACAKFSFIMEATYSATIMVKEAMRYQYKACIENVKMFLVKNEVDPVLRHRFINYLQLCWYTDKAYSITHGKSSIHFDLPQHVYQDISALQRNKYIVCVPFMKYLHPEIVKTLCAKAHLFYTSPQEILLNTGDICNEIYVIKQGFCEVIDPTTKHVVSIMTEKKHFGDVECLMRIPAYYTVRAVSHVQIFSISRKHLGAVFATPKIKDAILHCKLQQEYIKLIHNRKLPFLKYEMSPPATSWEIFPILRKHEPDTAFLQPFHNLGFFSITRYMFPRFTIRPDGKYLRRYEWFRAVCALLSAFIFPVYYLLVLQFTWLEYVAYFLDISAYYDVFQRLLVAYFNADGILVYHPVSTAAHYIRGPMIADLLGCLPFEHCDDLQQTMYSKDKYRWTPNTMQFLMCNRILQLYRFPSALEFLDEYIERQDIIFVIKAIPILMVVINTVTSFLLLLSVTRYGVKEGGWLLKPIGVDSESWIITNGHAVGYNITETPLNVFITVYYWATYEITTTGFNCFQPNRYAQLIVLICGMLIGSIMIPYFSVRVLSIRSNVNQALAAFQENMKDLTVFMEREQFRKDLQQEALSYYEYTWTKTGGTDYRSILKLCDQITLRTDAILHIYGHTFHKCPILYRCDPSLQRLLGRAVHSVYYRVGMTIIDRDDVTAELYFVDYGIMEARDPEDDDLIATKLPRGSMFGNLDNKDTVVCPNRFVANTNLHLLMIEAWLFYKILQDFPAIKERMHKFRPNDENYIIGSLRNQSQVQLIWKEHAMSTAAIIIVTKEGLLKYLHTHDKIIQVTLIIASIICVYGDLYNAAFQDNRAKLITLLYAMDVLFMCKIGINYFMPLITEENSESRHALEKAKKKYYRGEFKYDILSVLPIEIFCFLFQNTWMAFACLRLNRFLRVTTIYNNLKQYHERLSINLTATTITATLIWFTLFVHTSTCLWYLLGVLQDYIEPRTSWRWNQNKTCLCVNDYICSVYFVMTTFSQNGVGDILPRQRAEVLFVIWLMILSTMMYMIYVGEFSNIMQYQFFRCFRFYSEFLELKEFLKYNRVSRNLINLTYRYTLHLWRTSRGLQVPLFLKDAPPCLHSKLMAAAYMKDLRKHPAFKHCERPFLRHVVRHFKPFTYHEDMYVVREGEITNSMYFVHKGSIQEMTEDEDGNTQIFETGEFFGTTQGLFRETPYTYSYKTLTKSQVLTLSLNDWEYLLQHFPENKHTIYKPHKGLGDFKEKKRTISKTDEHNIRKDQSEEGAGSPLTGIPSSQQSQDVEKKNATTIRFGIPSGRESAAATPDERVAKSTQKESLKILSASKVAAVATAAAARLADDSTPTAQGSEIESTLTPSSQMIKRATVLDINRTARSKKTKELFSESADSNPSDSRQAIDRYMKSQALKQLSAQPTNIISPWPLDSRRRFSLQETAAMQKADPHTSKDKNDDHTSPVRRKSTILGIDKAAIDEELKKISSGEKEESPETYDYSRRKKTIHGIDKSVSDKESSSIKDFLTPLGSTESVASVQMPSHSRGNTGPETTSNTGKPIESLKSSLGKAGTPEIKKSFLQKIKDLKPKSKLKSHTKNPRDEENNDLMIEEDEATTKALLKSLEDKPPGKRDNANLAEVSQESGKKAYKRASSILFKDDVTTIVIPNDDWENKTPSLEIARATHSSDVSKKEDKPYSPSKDKPTMSEKSPTKLVFADDIKLKEVPSASLNIETLKKESVESVVSNELLPQKEYKNGKNPKPFSSKTPEVSPSKGPQASSSKKPEESSSKGPQASSSKKPEESSSKGPEASLSKGSEASLSKGSKASLSKGPKASSSKKPEAYFSKSEISPSQGPQASSSKKAEESSSKGPQASSSKKPEEFSSKTPEGKGSEASLNKGSKASLSKGPEATSSKKPEAYSSKTPEGKGSEASLNKGSKASLSKGPEATSSKKPDAYSSKSEISSSKGPEASSSRGLQASSSQKPEKSSIKGPEASSSKGPEAFTSKGQEASSSKGPEASTSMGQESSSSKGQEASSSRGSEASSSKRPEASSSKLEASSSKKPEASSNKKPGVAFKEAKG